MEPEGPQMAIWRLVSCWISKTTCAQAHSSACASTHVGTRAHAHTQMYVRLTGLFTATVVSSARRIVTLHLHCLSSFTFFFIYFCPIPPCLSPSVYRFPVVVPVIPLLFSLFPILFSSLPLPRLLSTVPVSTFSAFLPPFFPLPFVNITTVI